MRLSLTLEDTASGIEKKIKVKRQKKCDICSGSGAKTSGGKTTCPQCGGSGELRQVSRSMFGQFVNISTCPNCEGEGRIVKDRASLVLAKDGCRANRPSRLLYLPE